MNKSKSYFVIQNPNNERPLTEEEILSNLNPLLQEGKLLQEPIETYIGKGYSYKEKQFAIEVDGCVNVMQVMEQEITEQGARNHCNFSVQQNENLLKQHPTATMDEVYANGLMQTLINAIQKKQDLTHPLAALEEYNVLTQQKQKDLGESTTPRI